ncbi:outer membrane beta-barrel protein [Azospirillum sp. B4]|uniref:outer membrane beta-barrel protein n=1 Tax=Azospirillum sp. B4 TaxID=95605 RepID=UPI00131EFE7A|nr:outer membrane beta-barrel protein [Azospirillum sp. B4]
MAPHLATAQSATNDLRRGAESSSVVTEQGALTDDGGVGDPQRVNAAYQPKGIAVGNYILFPLVDLSETYNSNIYATQQKAKSDFITRIAPEIWARSQFADDQLNFLGRLEQSYYKTFNHDSHLDATLHSDGLYHISRDTQFSGSVDATQAYEDRGSPDDQGGLEPVRTRNIGGQAALQQQLGRFTVSGSLAGGVHDFHDVPRTDGGVIDEDDRDRSDFTVTGRTAYELYPGYAAVGQASFNKVMYDQKVDDDGFKRSSQGYRLETGVGVDLTQLIRGDFLIGYLHQNIDDPRFKDPSGLAVKVAFNWTPDRMTVVVPSLERSLQETTLSRSSQIVHSGGGVLVRRELQRNVVVTFSSYIYNDDFEGSGRQDWTYDNRLRAIWSLAPEYYIGAEIGYRRRYSSVENAAFSQQVGLLRFGLRV